jgi:hypothetical protein
VLTMILTTFLSCILASLTLPYFVAGSVPKVSIEDVTFIGRRTSESVELFGGEC